MEMVAQHTDQKYVEALLNNNVQALNEVYTNCSHKIKALVLQNSGTDDDAADIMQEGLIAIYQRAKTKPFTLTCPFEAYLYMVCRNLWLMHLRKQNRSPVTIKDVEQYNIGSNNFAETEEVVNTNQRRNLLEKKLQELGQGCQDVIKLSWSGKPMDEVAQILNNTYAYVRKKKSECMGKLTALIKHSPEYALLKW
jgi:RNA polymerase sigma factor (sigma-70 family)